MSCGDPHEVDCQQVLARAFEYLDGELDEQDLAVVRQHFNECAPCLQQHEFDALMKALVRRGCGCEQAPAELRAKIMVRMTQIRIETTEG